MVLRCRANCVQWSLSVHVRTSLQQQQQQQQLDERNIAATAVLRTVHRQQKSPACSGRRRSSRQKAMTQSALRYDIGRLTDDCTGEIVHHWLTSVCRLLWPHNYIPTFAVYRHQHTDTPRFTTLSVKQWPLTRRQKRHIKLPDLQQTCFGGALCGRSPTSNLFVLAKIQKVSKQ